MGEETNPIFPELALTYQCIVRGNRYALNPKFPIFSAFPYLLR